MPDAAETIESLATIFRDAPAARVYVAPDLRGVWELVPYLYCDRLRLACGPEIDQAQLSYRYGTAIRESPARATRTLYPPQDLLNKFCKIEIPCPDFKPDIVWYGQIEIDDREVLGSRGDGSELQDKPSGRQTFTAFGLLRLLEREVILSAVVANTPTTTLPELEQTIAMGLQFNDARGVYADKAGDYDDRGNRSTNPPTAGEPFVFSEVPQRQEKWTAFQAVEYLLEKHFPTDAGDTAICTWVLSADFWSLSWYDIDVPTDGRTVKEVLDQLIDRRRGVGYYVTFDGKTKTATINVFTAFDTQVTLSSGIYVPANPNTRRVDFEQSLDVEVRLTNSVATQYDRVVALGEWKTSTCTLTLDGSRVPPQIVPDWTTAEETLYKNAASGDAGYGALDPLEQAKRNQRYREGHKVRHVYARFILNSEWTQRAYNLDLTSGIVEYFVAPTSSLLSDGTVSPIDPYSSALHNAGEQLWTNGIVILPSLPFKDRFDYSGTAIGDGTFATSAEDFGGEPEYLPPMWFVRVVVGATAADDRYEFVDRLSNSAPYEDINRTWSAHPHLLHQRAGFELRCNGVPQHFLAVTSASGMAAVDEMHDADKQGGIQYDYIRCTLALRLQSRVSEEALIGTETVLDRQERIRYINVPHARLDYVVPKTTVAITNGAIVLSDGGFVRDDRPRLAQIVRAAAEWYGRPRQTIQMRIRQIAELVQLGWLITDIGPTYRLTGVNTPVTAITYDLLKTAMEVETSYADLEFV